MKNTLKTILVSMPLLLASCEYQEQKNNVSHQIYDNFSYDDSRDVLLDSMDMRRNSLIDTLINLEEDRDMQEKLHIMGGAVKNGLPQGGSGDSYDYRLNKKDYNHYLMNKEERIKDIKRNIIERFCSSKKDREEIVKNLHITPDGFSYTMKITNENKNLYAERHSSVEGSLDFNSTDIEVLSNGTNMNEGSWDLYNDLAVGDVVKITGRYGKDIQQLPYNKTHTAEKRKIIDEIERIDKMKKLEAECE